MGEGADSDHGTGLRAVQAFFAPRAAGWEDRFPDDGPAYRQAVADLAPARGGVALDAGCGTGRALEVLAEEVGAEGLVVGLDATPEMLAVCASRGRTARASLLRGDAWRLPLAGRSVDAILAAGLVSHWAEPRAGLAELARVTRSGGRLAVFHPIGRVALAARHGRAPSEDDANAPERLLPALVATGWEAVTVDDSAHRFLVLAVRT